MSSPRAFQVATIAAALQAFDSRRKVRRFLVADEVGLGKTIVARGVIDALMQRKRRSRNGPLRVFYVCSSLAIAAQNRESLLQVLPDPEERVRAASDVDRLTLAPNRLLLEDVPLHLYTLTPETSVPDRRGKHRSGSVEERALIHNLLARKYPQLLRVRGRGDWLQRNATANWGGWKSARGTQPRPELAQAFFPVLRDQLGLAAGQHLSSALRQRVEEDPLEAIKQLRIALARTGLERLSPDLVIFDEFQRFQDMLAGDERSDIASEMVKVGRGGPAVLLLSATPYRLYGGDLEHAFDETPHHEQFFELVEWLHGGGPLAKEGRSELEAAFQRYGNALRSSTPAGPETLAAKLEIEERLRPHIARTERFCHEAGRDAAELVEVAAPLLPEDLQAYRHLVECFRGKREDGSAGPAVPYWSSVPLPMQLLGPEYVAWKAAARKPLPSAGLGLTLRQVERFGGPKAWPHPRLRSFEAREDFAPSRLALPWLPPSFAWWPLGSAWRDAPPQKALVFSRFRAVPRAIAGLLSYDVERTLLRKSGLRFDDVTEKIVLGPQRENLAFFHPSRVLADLVDPWALRGRAPEQLRSAAEAHVRRALDGQGISVQRNRARARTLPELLVLLERRLGAWEASLAVWRKYAQSVARAEGSGTGSLLARIDQWNVAVSGSLGEVSRDEVGVLAEAALAAPGPVLARCFGRHGLDLQSASHLALALRTSWGGLRSYLNNPWMRATLGGGKSYRDRIASAILDGNLEAVLDEHLWVTSTLRHLDPAAVAEQLLTALSLRTSDIKLYGLGGKDFPVRAHAALAFTQAVRRHRPDEREDAEPAVRTDDLRIAFNSPFWPHVLASTSVGQEGLDFHTWCSTVAHWDLPGDPVDLEQREGRIDRYAGLATRRILAERFAPGKDDVPPGTSPWSVIAQRADESYRDDPIGLAPWWVIEGARVRRLVFDVPLSEAHARFEELRQQRLLYRLTLGQPDQADLVNSLHGRLSAEEVVSATINLSPCREG